MAAPAFNVFTVKSAPDGSDRKAKWIEIGAAFRHQQGDGYNIVLDALPIDGRLVLMPRKEGDAS